MDKLKRWWFWLLHGTVVGVVASIDCGVVSEVAYRGRYGYLVGWWAYGGYDPSLPYQGQPWVTVKQWDGVERYRPHVGK